MSTLMRYTLVALILGLSAGASARKVALFPFDVTNVNTAHVGSAEKLLRIYLLENGFPAVVVVDPAGPKGREWAPEEARVEAVRLQVDVFIMGTILRLQERAKVSLTMYEAHTGLALASDSMSATTPDDFDAIMKRLARSLATGKKASESSEIGEVTQEEEDAYKRRMATNYFGIKVVGFAPFKEPLSQDPMLAGFGAYWMYDIRWLLMHVDAVFGFGDKTPFLFDLDLGVSYPLLRTDMTPYIGGGLGFAAYTTETTKKTSTLTSSYESTDSDTARGLDVWGGIGFLLGRQSSVSGTLEVRYVINLFEEFTHGLRIALGIGF